MGPTGHPNLTKKSIPAAARRSFGASAGAGGGGLLLADPARGSLLHALFWGGGVPEIRSTSLCGSARPLFNQGRVSLQRDTGTSGGMGIFTKPDTQQEVTLGVLSPLLCLGASLCWVLVCLTRSSHACLSDALQAGWETWHTEASDHVKGSFCFSFYLSLCLLPNSEK